MIEENRKLITIGLVYIVRVGFRENMKLIFKTRENLLINSIIVVGETGAYFGIVQQMRASHSITFETPHIIYRYLLV